MGQQTALRGSQKERRGMCPSTPGSHVDADIAQVYLPGRPTWEAGFAGGPRGDGVGKKAPQALAHTELPSSGKLG